MKRLCFWLSRSGLISSIYTMDAAQLWWSRSGTSEERCASSSLMKLQLNVINWSRIEIVLCFHAWLRMYSLLPDAGDQQSLVGTIHASDPTADLCRCARRISQQKCTCHCPRQHNPLCIEPGLESVQYIRHNIYRFQYLCLGWRYE